MMRTYYHGTSADNLDSILKYGIIAHSSKIWNCSQDEVYLWDPVKIKKSWECANIREAQEKAFQLAFASGQIACAKAKDVRIVVIELRLDDVEIYDDSSCENMDDAVCIGRTVFPTEFKKISITNDLFLIKGYFIALIINRELSNIEFTEIEQRVGKLFSSSDLIDEIEFITTWETIKLPK